MKRHLDQLERLGSPYPLDLATNIILNPLPKCYDTFIMNYNMNEWDKSISELHGMLKIVEKNIPRKTPQVLMIWGGGQVKNKNQCKNSKGKPQDGNSKGKKGPQNLPPKKKEKVAKNDTSFECGVVGEGPSGISILMSEMGLFTFSSNTWVFDIGCGAHICNSLQGFRKSRELKIHDMVLHLGNGARVAVQAIGHFDLCLPCGLYLTLNNVCLITSITRNIVSDSRLRKSDKKLPTNSSLGLLNAFLLDIPKIV
uniref:Retrovirus-related Pol polyprotein from transposon TNT 1-94-like beta-barrel domain-containing protein n=1 Tax=Lactuca sativa TaxID=4236 RepID=A0A9R1V7T5_LACSA|nr:hypothetical protein LSAT_V11C600313920 [Lactuca sativa]